MANLRAAKNEGTPVSVPFLPGRVPDFEFYSGVIQGHRLRQKRSSDGRLLQEQTEEQAQNQIRRGLVQNNCLELRRT
jgi:catalase (peroxidase I)